jgi:hypothetical protein
MTRSNTIFANVNGPGKPSPLAPAQKGPLGPRAGRVDGTRPVKVRDGAPIRKASPSTTGGMFDKRGT